MQTIHTQLKQIRTQSSYFQEVLNNYEMGLITMVEKHNQLLGIINSIDEIRKDICKEYGINSNAVNLMLEL